MTTEPESNQKVDQKAEPQTKPEEECLSFRQRWFNLIEETMQQRWKPERLTIAEFGGSNRTGIVFQAAIVALIDHLRFRKKCKTKDQAKDTGDTPEKEEAGQ